MSKYQLRSMPDPARVDPAPRPSKAAASKSTKPSKAERANHIGKSGRTRAEERKRLPNVAKRNK